MPETTTATETTKGTETTQTTQQATQAAPQKPPPGYRPGYDMPPQPPQGPEDDPNFKLRSMIGRRGKKEEVKTETKTEETGEKKAETTETKAETKPDGKGGDVAGLIAQALKFRKPDATKESKTETKASEGATKEPDPTTKAPDPATKATATVVTKKKAEPVQPNPMQIASEAAAAAASAAVTAATAGLPRHQAKTEAPEDALPDDFRYEYEVAKHLSATNPKYKDAPQRILNEFKRRAEYARTWEAQNPGKVFDPEDEEHNALEESLERPWSDHEFRRAEIQLEAKALAHEQSAEDRKKLRDLEERNAKAELAPIAGQTVNSVALLLAENVDKAAHDLITKEPGGFAKLQENDPITAEALVDALNALAPRIQTAIFVDDPERRIDFNAKKNPDQAEWLKFLFEKEAQYAGTTDERGRLFASRTEYVQLPQAQQARRWYLTQDHLISEMVAEAVTQVKSRVEKERERGKKVAAALGYVPKPESSNGKPGETHKSGATNETKETKSETTTTTETKPVSPTVGSGAKIDTQGDKLTTKNDDLWAKTGKILFGR